MWQWCFLLQARNEQTSDRLLALICPTQSRKKNRSLFYMNIKPLWLLHLYLFYYVFTENLALHQPAWQSSTYLPYTANLAVDGQYTRQCAVSDLNRRKTTVEWRVDLGGVKNIHHVFIHHVGQSILGIIY